MGEEWEGCACALGWSDFVLCGFSKLGTCQVVPNCCRTPILKYHFLELPTFVA